MKYISNYFGQTKILAVLFLLSLAVTVNAFPLLGKKKAKKDEALAKIMNDNGLL